MRAVIALMALSGCGWPVVEVDLHFGVHTDAWSASRRLQAAEGAVRLFSEAATLEPRMASWSAPQRLDLGQWQREGTRKGAITVLYVRDFDIGGYEGYGGSHAPCRPLIAISDIYGTTPQLLAHEIGHALGLLHHPDPRNLMHWQVGDTALTDWQLGVANMTADILEACDDDRPNRPG